ncbi:glycosyltransferase family 4 protein [Sphingomonas sp. PB2P19]|uniref:glycosyltransferase family 4 protein n=1 Tax=Sphingomonas rhamnosi TaxID=3096156 RepID=UPI002FCA70EF
MKNQAIDVDHRESGPPLTIGLLTWAYPPEKSGLSRAAREIAQALAQAGHDVRVFTMDRRDRTNDGAVEVIGCGVGEHSGPARLRKLAGIGHAVGPLAFLRAVRAEHARRPFDVIEATNWYAPGLAIALLGPAPLVTRNSTPAATSAATVTSLRDRLDRGVAILLERWSARAGMLISNTALHAEKIAALYRVPREGPRHAVIGLSLPPEITARGQAATYPTGTPVELLFVGRDEHRKGFDALLGALAILAEDAEAGTLDPFRLTIIGVTDDAVAHLPPAARVLARCYHRVDEPRLHDLLAATHLVVAPSRYESFGIVYQEAMMFGRPIVACAEDPSARLFVGGSGAGLLAATCSGPDLAEPLRRLIQDPAARAALAATSRAASGQFTRETLATQTVAAYRTAIGSKGSSSRVSSSGRPAPADMPS